MLQPVSTRIVHALAAACLVLTLSACTEGEPTDPTPAPPLSPTASASPTKGSTSKPDGPPQMPNKAKKNTNSGAASFVKHYINVQNYATATGNTKPMRKLYDDFCTKCEKRADIIDRIYRAGGYHKGEQWKLTSANYMRGGNDFTVVNVVVKETGGNIRQSGEASPIFIRPRRDVPHRFEVVHTGDSWKVVAVDPNLGLDQ